MFHVSLSNDFARYAPNTVTADTPVVIHVPGFNEDHLSAAPFGLRMAQAGWCCYALHPVWSATPDLQSPSPAILFELFDQMELILQRTLAEVQGSRWLALTGFSMGGMFVSRILTKQAGYPFRAAAMVLSSGDWSFLPRTAVHALPSLRAAVSDEALVQIEAAMRSVSPVASAEMFPPLPLLLLNADRDPRVPLDNARSFYDTLHTAYDTVGALEGLEFQIVSGNRHEFRRHMQWAVRDWMVAQYVAGNEGDRRSEETE